MTNKYYLGMAIVGLWCGGCAASTPKPERPVAPEAPRSLLSVERPSPKGGGEPHAVLRSLKSELSRSFSTLKKQDPEVFYMGYTAEESEIWGLAVTQGVVSAYQHVKNRGLDVDLRVGSHEFDNTRQGGDYEPVSAALPLEDDPLALRVPIWLATEEAYRNGVEQLIALKAVDAVSSKEDEAPDFSMEKPVKLIEPMSEFAFALEPYIERAKALSRVMIKVPELLIDGVDVSVSRDTRFFASTEGSEIQTTQVSARLTLRATAIAPDGMMLWRERTFFAREPDDLPDQATAITAAEQLASQVKALRVAPLGEPYSGPAILDGEAAAVLAHEVLGHRVEGHRQKRKGEGQTFKQKIGERVMPRGFDIYDDPTIKRLNGTDLGGFYFFDDEGIAGQRATILKDGVFQGFLMSRSPLPDFARSNGHGRRESGHGIVARQANLIVEPSRPVARKLLLDKLISMLKKQNKPYGLRVEAVAGGHTLTDTYNPQAFEVRPVLVYRVYPDGRQELIRGVKLEGTPLNMLSQVVAAGDDFSVFNGRCGAESGMVPVAAVSPSLLVSQIEVTRAPRNHQKPPILPAPERTRSATGGG